VIHSVCLGYSQCSGRMERLGNSPVCLKGVPITVQSVPEAPKSSSPGSEMTPSSSSSSSSSSSFAAAAGVSTSSFNNSTSSDAMEKQQQISTKLTKLKSAVALIGEERKQAHAEYIRKAQGTRDLKELEKLKAEYMSKLDESQRKMKRVQEAVNRITYDYNRELIEQEKASRQPQRQQQQRRSTSEGEGKPNSETKEIKLVLSSDAVYKALQRMQNNVESGEMRKTLTECVDFTTMACKQQYRRLKNYYENHGKDMPERIYDSGKKIIANMPKTVEKVGNVVSKIHR